MRLSNKIFLYFGTFIFFIVLILVLVNYLVMGKILHTNVQEEIQKISESVNTAAATILDSSIRNYMRGVVEQDFLVLEMLYQQSQDGTLTEQQAKDAFQKHVLEHVIGKSGYIVALRHEHPKIWIDIHPHVRGTDCAFNKGCQEWVAQKNGYNKYEWKNPNDETIRQKVGYFRYFEPWNWIVGATSYKDEFTSFIKIDDLRELIEPFNILENGYFFVMSKNYDMLVHPELEGKNVYNIQNEEGRFVAQEIASNSNKFYYYNWKNPSEKEEREKFVYTQVLDDFEWYICASGYVDDITAPVRKLLYIRLIVIAAVAVVLLLITILLSRSLTRPLNSLNQGLNDFYRKKQIFKMPFKSVKELNAVGYAIESMTENLVNAEREKQSILDELDSIINSMPSMLVGLDRSGRITHWNNKAAAYLGVSRQEALGKQVDEVLSEFWGELGPIKQSIDSQSYYSHSFEIIKEGSTRTHFDVTFFPLKAGMHSAVIRIDDTTDKVIMQESLMQSQKMESLGTLAGGIAHDFNNILSAIYGYAELIKTKLEPGNPSVQMLDQLFRATDRAKGLVQQILLFSRQTEHKRRFVEPHTIIEEALKLLRPSIPKTIEINQNISDECGSIYADPTQVHQIIMNLCTNAYHAMRDEGGTLTVNLFPVSITRPEIISKKMSLEPGNYIEIEVIDTGHGMEQITVDKVFDPFYTTKKVGEGTGLGLSVVHGIVKGCQGHIQVESELEKGTTISILFPVFETQNIVVEEKTDVSFEGGNEHILLVDDEEPVLDVTSRFLENLGYKITACSNSVEAFELFINDPDIFDLIITDMTMPKMTGLELAKKIISIKSTAPIIMRTGFSDLINKEKAHSVGIKEFLTKPVLGVDMAKAIREVLLG